MQCINNRASSKNTGRVCVVIQGGTNTSNEGSTAQERADAVYNQLVKISQVITAQWVKQGNSADNITFVFLASPITNNSEMPLLSTTLIKKLNTLNITVVEHNQALPQTEYVANSLWDDSGAGAGTGTNTAQSHLTETGYISWGTANNYRIMADIERDIVLRVKSETEQAQGQFKSLKQELRTIEQQLNQMAEAGDTGSKAFQELQKRAGQVKDQIGDTKSAIKALSSDTFKLDAFSQAAQGIAGGFAAAQGAMALFGSENKQVEEAIKKTQGAMALLQGVTTITNILQKESALRLSIATTAQGAYTAVVGASTGAMKLFRIALASTGIGLLVVGLGLLIANFEDVKKVVMNLIAPFDGIIAKVRDFLSTISFGLIDDSSTAKTKANAEKSLEAINKLAKGNESIEKQMQRNIDIAKAKGKNDKEVFELEKQLLEFRLKNNYAEQEAIKRKIKAGNATDEERKKLFELVQSARDLLKDKTVLEINYTNKQKEETTKQNKKGQRKKNLKSLEVMKRNMKSI